MRKVYVFFAVVVSVSLLCPPVAQAQEGDNASPPSLDPPTFVLLRRSQLEPPQGRTGDVLVIADPAVDELAHRTTEVFSDPNSYPHFALRLHQFAKNYVAHNPALFQVDLAALSEPTYLFLSDRRGGFPASGFWLEQSDGTLRDMSGVPFVDIQFGVEALSGDNFGDLDQIFPHELGHIILRELAGQSEQRASQAIHFVTVRTDPWYAFDEGWGEHFQPAAIDHGQSRTMRVQRSEPLPSIDAGWYARFAREQWHGCYFCPANLTFLLWQSKGEQHLRDGAVRDNHFIYQVTLPQELRSEQRAPYEAILYRDVVPPTPGAALKNGAQMLASEGVISTLFYRLVTDVRLQNIYREPVFYEQFLPVGQTMGKDETSPQDLFSPEENVYLKLFHVFAHDVTWEVGCGPSPMVQVISGYAERFPDEAELVYDIFLDVTRGVTVDAAAAIHHNRTGYLLELRQRLLNGQASLDDNLGPSLWLTNPDFEGGWGVFRYFALRPPFNFDLNAADAADLRTVPGVSVVLADRIITTREERGGFQSVDDLEQIEGMTPELLTRFQTMHAQMEQKLDSSQSTEDDLALLDMLLALLIGSYVLAALFQIGRLLFLSILAYGAVWGITALGSAFTQDAGRPSVRLRGLRMVGRGLGVALFAFLVSLVLYAKGVIVAPWVMGATGLGTCLVFSLLRRVLPGAAWTDKQRAVRSLVAWAIAFAVVGMMY